MPRLTFPLPPAAAAVIVLAVVGASGCGGSDSHPKAAPTPGITASTTPTGTPTGVPVPTATVQVPSAGLPTDFPGTDVPLVGGSVSQPLGPGSSGPEGKKGWVLDVAVPQTPQQCFATAAGKLVAAGYTKHGQITAGNTVQAQYTKPGYAVIISARSDGATGCIIGYEVGQVAK